MKSTSRLLKILPVFLAWSAITASGETLFTRGFDTNTGATVLPGNTNNDTVISSSLTFTDPSPTGPKAFYRVEEAP